MPKHRILVVDDEAAVRFGVRDYLETHGYEVDEAATCLEAERLFRSTRPDAVVLDYRLPDGDALRLMPRLKAVDGAVPLVILTAHGSIDLAVEAVKQGAEQFLTKPVELDSLRVILQRLLEARRDRRTKLAHQASATRSEVDPFRGTSPAIRQLADQVERVLDADSSILVLGPTGAGKSVLARWIHRHGPRGDEAIVDLNCAGLSREFLESELFGHERGAFTGAVASKPGMLELGHRGTVFLDEVGDLHLEVQAKLLKVLEEKRFRRMGEVRDRVVDVRLISATHHDLAARVRGGAFRSDLYFRISTIPLRIPALAERREDIALLAAYLLDELRRDLGRPGVHLTAAAEVALRSYDWPGNIRELRNVLERAVLLSRGEAIRPEAFVFDPGLVEPHDLPSADLTLLEAERQHIERVLRREHGNVSRAAERLGVPRSTLYEKLKRFDLRAPGAPAPQAGREDGS